MRLSESGTVDICERALRTALSSDPDLPQHNERHLRKALAWYRGETNESMSLLECMIVVRLTGDEFAVQLDTQSDSRYLRFDNDRSRVVVVDPETMRPVPVEETDISTFFTRAAVTFVPTHTIGVETHDAITAVTHPDRGTKIVLGRHPDGFTQYTEDEGEVVYESKTVFELPRPMTPDEIDEWLRSEAAGELKQLVRANHERGW